MSSPAFNHVSGVCVYVCVFNSTGQFLGRTRNSNSTDFKNKGRNPEPFCENSQGKLFVYFSKYASSELWQMFCLEPAEQGYLPWVGGCGLTSLGRASCELYLAAGA